MNIISYNPDGLTGADGSLTGLDVKRSSLPRPAPSWHDPCMDTRYAHTDGATALSQEEVMLGSLIGTLPAEVKPAPLGTIDKITRSRIRYGVSELVGLNIDNVNRWLALVADGQVVDGKVITSPNPRGAIELFLELLQFSVPKMKAVSVDVRTKDGSLKRLSASDLQSIVSEQ